MSLLTRSLVWSIPLVKGGLFFRYVSDPLELPSFLSMKRIVFSLGFVLKVLELMYVIKLNQFPSYWAESKLMV